HQSLKYETGIPIWRSVMLSPKSAEIVRATLPAVGGAIGEIAEVFYRKMFTAHPELLRDLFNRGSQAVGEQQQALAGSIAAFATTLVEQRTPFRRRCSTASRTNTPRSG